MGTRFKAPKGALRSNLGLLAGTVIRELRMHPFWDDELVGVPWNFRPEWLEFSVLSIVAGGYLCRYSGAEDTFLWPSWKKQPNYGFMKDGSTPVSRFTGIPKHMLQSGKESYESNAQQRVVFVQDTLAPYVVQWEQENSFKCLLGFQRAAGLYFKGNLSVLLRGDDKSRAEFYEKMVQNSILNPDECRSLEERNPIPGGLGAQFLATKNLGSLESILRGEEDNG